MKYLVLLLALLPLTACSSLRNAGTSSYSIEPVIAPDGTAVCCKVNVENGKEIDTVEAIITKQGDNYNISLKEKGVKAFEGQQVSADALTKTVESAVKGAVEAMKYGL